MSPSRIFALIALALAAAPAALPQVPSGTLPAVTTAPANTFLAPGATGTLDLSTVFGLPSVTGTVVQFQTVLGNFNIELYNTVASLNCANFLGYVNSGAYNNTLIQRLVPGFIIQGGGYTIAPPNNLSQVTSTGTVKNEYSLPNIAGSMAMALAAGDPNSASTNWFFNLVDNSSQLDNTSSGGGPFTVFAHVIGTGMTVINAIAAEPTYNLQSETNADFQTTPLINVNTAVGVVYANWVRIPSMAVIPIYPSSSTSTAVLSFTATSSNPSAIAATVAGRTLTLKAGSTGGATITLTATDTNGNQATATFTAGVNAAPAITTQPVSQTVTAGATTVFSVAATGFPIPTYQWNLNNAPISGATSSRLVLSGAALTTGYYSVTVTNPLGSVTSNQVNVGFLATTNPGRLVNLSMLSNISGSLSMGFVIGGAGTSGNENLLIRAVGPSIGPGTAFNVSGVMPDPTLTVVQQTNNAISFKNAGWASTSANQSAVTTADNATGAFGLTVATSKDSALVESLPPVSGGYSATVTGASGDGGNALTEVYDDTSSYTTASTRLLNLSCLTNISAGSTIDVGFVIGGTTAKTVFIRASGPTLAVAPFNLGGTMADPQIVVSPSANSGNVISANAGWAGDSVLSTVAANIGAFAFAGPTSLDSATVVTLEPGVPYAVQVNSASGGGGEVLVEIYEVP